MQHLPKLLLIEDNPNMASALEHALQSSYDVDTATTGKIAVYKSELSFYDLIVLDLNLPDMSGLLVCQQLRNHGVTVPILILSGEIRTVTKINLLDAGANDYLTKPFVLGELKARLRVLQRIGQTQAASRRPLQVGNVQLNRQTYEVSRDGVAIRLRRKEFALLECLLENAGAVVTRAMLARIVWQGSDGLWTNTLDVHIKCLRDKIDRPFERPLIRTVHGRGYKLEVAEPAMVSES